MEYRQAKVAGRPGGAQSPVGKSMALFDDLPVGDNASYDQVSNSAPKQPRGRVGPGCYRLHDDEHMQAAWRLSNALRGKSPAARQVRKLNPQQRRQLGSVICEHLVASLRAQAAAERH